MGDPETKVDAAVELANSLAEQKDRREKAALNDGSDGKVVPIKLDLTQGARVRGIVSYPGKPRSGSEPKTKVDDELKARSKAKPAKEALDEALINEIILGEQQTKGNGHAGPNFTFKEAPKEDQKAKDEKDDEDEEAVRSEAPSAVKALGLAEAKRRFMIRRLKLQEINHKYAVIRVYGGKCVVVTTGRSPINPNKKVFLIQSREAFEQWMANDFIPSLSKTDKDEAVGPWWWRHPKREQFDGVVFEPLAPRIVKTSDGKRLFNTYLGWGVVPKQGNWSLIRRHIKEVLANGDPKTEDYIIRWTAWSIQHPDLLPLVALVLIGLKGRGKGTFARVLERVFGDHSLQISSQRHIVGNFNAHLENLILMISDEAYWAGHKADAGTLQRMITEPTLAIEAKGYDVRNVKNRIHLLMLAEPGWSVPAGQDERRYAVFEVCDKVRDEAYFKALYREIEGDGPAAMLFDLQQMKLGDWHPRQIHKTSALRRQQEMNLDGHLEEWLLTLLDDGCLPHPAISKPWMSDPTNLLNDAKAKVPRLRDLSFNALATFLREWGCVKSGGDVRYWRFPSLAEMRTAWDQRYTPRKWPLIEDWGQPARPEPLDLDQPL